MIRIKGILRNEAGEGGEGGGDGGDAGGDLPPAFSLYTGEKGSRVIRPELAAMLEGDEYAPARKEFEKYANADNPDAAYFNGVKSKNYLLSKKDVDLLTPLPEDAPEALKQERISALRKMNEVPDEASGYGIERPEDLPDGVYWPEGIEEKHMELAHKYNVNPAFLKEQFAMHTEMMNGIPAMEEAALAAATKESMDALRQEYGHDLQSVIDKADEGALSTGAFNKEQVALATEAMTKIGLGTNWIKALNFITDSIGEDKRISAPGAAPTGMSNEQKAQDIVNNPDNPLYKAYWSGGQDPRYDEALAQVRAFSAAAQKDKAARQR